VKSSERKTTVDESRFSMSLLFSEAEVNFIRTDAIRSAEQVD